MQFSNLQFKASNSLAEMLSNLVSDKKEGKYLITLNDDDYTDQNGGVRPCQIVVRKEEGSLILERLFECTFINNKLKLSNSFDFVSNEYSFEYIGLISAATSLDPNELAEVYDLFSTNIVCYYQAGLYTSVQIEFIL